MCKICSELAIKHRNDIDDVDLMFLLLALLLTDFIHCSLVSIVNFEQINASWSIMRLEFCILFMGHV